MNPGASTVAGACVTVCICTYKRPELLRRLLAALDRQQTAGGFSYSIVVADNDAAESAREVVTEFAGTSSVAVTYCVEREQNIALARNRALEQARGEYVAFIDDDEFPDPEWLATMLGACEAWRADGVLGPVRPFFDEPPPAWLVRSKLCERPEHPTGTRLDWRDTRSGNVLFRRNVLGVLDTPFRREFGNGGEDQDFFRRLMEGGRRFAWCNEAAVYEVVPAERRRRRYFLRRALRRGQNERRLLTAAGVATSLLAVPVYTALLPVACLFGQHVFMRYCVRLLDHVGRLLGAVGIEPAAGQYVGG
jgi:glycosyltransferase involved in cell wall biosynthesis